MLVSKQPISFLPDEYFVRSRGSTRWSWPTFRSGSGAIPLLRTAEPETGQLAPGRGQNEDFETNSKQNTQIKVLDQWAKPARICMYTFYSVRHNIDSCLGFFDWKWLSHNKTVHNGWLDGLTGRCGSPKANNRQVCISIQDVFPDWS